MSGGCGLLFVYGSLMRRAGGPWAKRLEALGEWVGEGSVPGRLYALGWYPGLRPAQADHERVRGEVWRLPDPAAAFAKLDPYEDCFPDSPETSLFVRGRVQALLDAGGSVECWIYEYKGPLDGADFLPSGDFLELARSGKGGGA